MYRGVYTSKVGRVGIHLAGGEGGIHLRGGEGVYTLEVEVEWKKNYTPGGHGRV